MKKLIYKFSAYIQITLLVFQHSLALANPLDPEVERCTLTLSLKGTAPFFDPATSKTTRTQFLASDLAVQHLSLDASLWGLAAGEQYNLVQGECSLLSASLDAEGMLRIKTPEKKLFLHAGKDSRLSHGSLLFESEGAVTLVKGELLGKSSVFAKRIFLGVNVANPIAFQENLTCIANQIENHTEVSGKKGALAFQSKQFTNEGRLKFKTGYLGFGTGNNKGGARIKAGERLVVAGESKGHRFGKFDNAGEIIGFGLIDFAGHHFVQRETGRILAGATFRGVFETYREGGKTRSPKQICIDAHQGIDLLEDGVLQSDMVFLRTAEGFTIKPHGLIKASHSVNIHTGRTFHFGGGRDGGIELLSSTKFPYHLFDSTKTTKTLAADISKYATAHRAELGLQGDFPSGVHLNVEGALMEGNVFCGNGSFILNTKKCQLYSTIRGGDFDHSAVIIAAARLGYFGSVESTKVVFDSLFGHLKGAIDAREVCLRGDGVLKVDQDIKTTLLQTSVRHLFLEPGKALESLEMRGQGGSIVVEESGRIKTERIAGSLDMLDLGGAFDTQTTALALDVLNIRPKGECRAGKGSMDTRSTRIVGDFQLKGNLRAEDLFIERESFSIDKELSLIADRARIKAGVLTNAGEFSAIDAALNLERWRNTQGSRVNIGTLRGQIGHSEFGGAVANFQNVRLVGVSITASPGSDVNVYETADIRLSGDFQLHKGYFEQVNFNVRRLLAADLQTPLAAVTAKEVKVHAWKGDQIQLNANHTDIYETFKFKDGYLAGQDLRFFPGSSVSIPGDGCFNFSHGLHFDGTTQIGKAWVRAHTLSAGVLQASSADIKATTAQMRSLRGDSLQWQVDHGDIYENLTFKNAHLAGQDLRFFPGSSVAIPGDGWFNFSNGLYFDGTTQIGNVYLKAHTLGIGGSLQTPYADVFTDITTLTGDWMGQYLRAEMGQTHAYRSLGFQDVSLRGHDFRTYRGGHVSVPGNGHFNLSGSFYMEGRGEMGNIWVDAHSLKVSGSLQTSYGSFNAQWADITGTLHGENLHGHLSSLHNSGTFRAKHGFDFRGREFHSSGFLGGKDSTRLDYDTYSAFGDLSSKALWMRIDDRNLASHDLSDIGRRSRLGHLEILTRRPACFEDSLHLSHGFTLTAPSVSFAARPRVFRLFGIPIRLPGHARFSSDQDLFFKTTSGDFLARDFDIEGRRTFVESASNVSVYGSMLKGQYLGVQGNENCAVIRTWRPSQLIGGEGEVETILAPRLDAQGRPILGAGGHYSLLPRQAKVGLHVNMGGHLFNDASNILSAGMLLISANKGITAIPRIIDHSETHTKRSWWGKKKTTTRHWQEVLHPMMGSSGGEALLYSSEGGMDLRALDVVGARGLTVMGREAVRISDVVTKSYTATKKSFGWGLKQSSSAERRDISNPTWVVSPHGNITVISQDKGIWVRGGEFMTPFHTSFSAKHGIFFSVSPLAVEHISQKSGFFVKPRILHLYDVVTADSFKDGFSKLTPFTQRLVALGDSAKGFNQVAAAVSAAVAGYNAYKSYQKMGDFYGFLGNQLGLLDSEGNFNTTIELGYAQSSSRIRFMRRGEGGISSGSVSFLSQQGDITFDKGFPVRAPESISLEAPQGDIIQRGFDSAFENVQKTQSFSVDVNPLMGMGLTGVGGHTAGSKTSGLTWTPQVLESRTIFISAKGWKQDCAQLRADHLVGDVEQFESRTRQNTLDHHHWSASFSIGVDALPTFSLSYGAREENLTAERSGVSVKEGVLRVGLISTTGSSLEFGDAAVFANEVRTQSLHDSISGEERGLSFTPGIALHALGIVFGEREYAAIQNSTISGRGILVNGCPFVCLTPLAEVTVDRDTNIAFEVPIIAQGPFPQKQQPKPGDDPSVVKKDDSHEKKKEKDKPSSSKKQREPAPKTGAHKKAREKKEGQIAVYTPLSLHETVTLPLFDPVDEKARENWWVKTGHIWVESATASVGQYLTDLVLHVTPQNVIDGERCYQEHVRADQGFAAKMLIASLCHKDKFGMLVGRGSIETLKGVAYGVTWCLDEAESLAISAGVDYVTARVGRYVAEDLLVIIPAARVVKNLFVSMTGAGIKASSGSVVVLLEKPSPKVVEPRLPLAFSASASEGASAAEIEGTVAKTGATAERIKIVATKAEASPTKTSQMREQAQAQSSKSIAEEVTPYEVGSYRDLAKRSKLDGMEIHHVPQSHPAQQVIKGYEAKSAPAIALPAEEHWQIPNIKGPYDGTPRDLLAADVRNLRTYTSAPNEQIKKLVERVKTDAPEVFQKRR